MIQIDNEIANIYLEKSNFDLKVFFKLIQDSVILYLQSDHFMKNKDIIIFNFDV